MYNHLLYFGYWVTNAIVLYFASILLPSDITLGSWRFSTLEASLYAGFCLTFLVWIWWDFALAWKFDFHKKLPVFLFFLFVNYFSILTITRFDYLTGFSITSFFWAFIIGFVATILQQGIHQLIVRQKSFRK